MIFFPTGFFSDHKHICILKIHHFLLSKKHHHKNHIAHSSTHQPTVLQALHHFAGAWGRAPEYAWGSVLARNKLQLKCKQVERKAKEKDGSGDTRRERDGHQILASINSRRLHRIISFL